MDVYPDEDNRKSGEAVWHAVGFSPGKQVVRLVVRGEPYEGSKGAEIALNDLLVFRK